MTCDKCGEEVLKMTFRDDGFGCEFCLSCDSAEITKAPGMIVRGDNKYAPKMTRAEIMNIKTRSIHPDGIVRAAKRWETKEW